MNFPRITRGRIGLAAIVVGLTISTIGGKIFLKKGNEIAEKAGQARITLYDSIYENKNIAPAIQQKSDDNTLYYSATAVVFGLILAGTGYAIARTEQFEWRSLRPTNYGKSFSDYRRSKPR